MTGDTVREAGSEEVSELRAENEELKQLAAELETRISEWVNHYNNHRYHEAINNVTLSDRFFGRDIEILEQRRKTKAETMRQRREIYRLFMINDLMGNLS